MTDEPVLQPFKPPWPVYVLERGKVVFDIERATDPGETRRSPNRELEALKREVVKGTLQCEICGDLARCADHNHETSQARGPLCYNCNVGLGMFADSPLLLEQAIRYLERRGHAGAARLPKDYSWV